jgi:hypothetical protein
LRKRLRYQREIVTARSDGAPIDGARGSSTDDGKWIPSLLNPFDFPDAFQNAGLIGPPRTSARHHQAEPVFHLHL